MAIPTATDELCVTEESCAAGYEGGGGKWVIREKCTPNNRTKVTQWNLTFHVVLNGFR